MTLTVAPCSHDAARYAAERWHYSRCLPNQKLVKYGVWEEDVFRGAVVFGDGANSGMLAPYGLDYSQGAELVRVALQTHQHPVTQIVARALALLRRQSAGLRLVLSFADPERGHVGVIYQAGGWIYLGRTSAADEYIVNGRRMHGRALRSTRSTHPQGRAASRNVLEWTRKTLDPHAYAVAGSSKYRYAMPLDRAMRRALLPLGRPYPKSCGRGVEGDAAVVLTAGAGSIPAGRSNMEGAPQ